MRFLIISFNGVPKRPRFSSHQQGSNHPRGHFQGKLNLTSNQLKRLSKFEDIVEKPTKSLKDWTNTVLKWKFAN